MRGGTRRQPGRRRLGAALIFAGATLTFLAANVARAGNGTHPRTPPVWPQGDACMRTVDRSVEPLAHFDYAVLADDLRPDGAPDEVETSRRHQFFALCQPQRPDEELPRWISQADVEDAAAWGLVPDGDAGPENILESSSEWSSCFERITADDDRREITMDQASMGFDWDTSTVDAGSYVVYGYTWEPTFNLWTLRPGVVRVTDDANASMAPAAAFVPYEGETLIYRDESVELEGCASGDAGSTWAIDYLVALNGGGGEWKPYLAARPLEGSSFVFTFTPPSDAWGEIVYLRVRVEDPSARTFLAHTLRAFEVQDADTPGCVDPGGSIIGDPGCEDGGVTDDGNTSAGESGDVDGTSSGDADSTSTGTDGPDAEDSGAEGCACTSAPSPAGGSYAALALLSLLGFGRRRRNSGVSPRRPGRA